MSRGGRLAGEVGSAWEELLASGTEVSPVPCDVGNADDVGGLMGAVVGPWHTNCVRIGGVMHLAGVLGEGMMSNVTRRGLEIVFGAKVFGAVNLRVALKAIVMDFFVLYSSVSAMLGSFG